MSDGFQHHRSPVVKNNRPSTARLLFAVGISLAGMAPFFVMAGFPFLDGDFSRLLELVPVVFFGVAVFLIISFGKKATGPKPPWIDDVHGYYDQNSTLNSSAFEMRNPRKYYD